MGDILDKQEEHQSIFSFLTSRRFLVFFLIPVVILVIFLGWKIIQARCTILKIQYCLSAEAYSYSVPGGQEFYVAFRLARDVPIFSPFDGEIFAAFVPPSLPAGFPKGASLMQIRTQDGGSAVALMGSIESKVNKGDVIRKGQVIAVSTQTLPGSPNDYTIAIWFLEKDAGGGMTRSEKLFRTFFPEISYIK